MSVKNKIVCDNQILEYGNEDTLLEVLCHNGYSASFCAGKGICGKCKVRFMEAPPLPTQADRRVLSPEELRKGIRLACQIPMKSLKDIQIETLFGENKAPILASFQNIPMDFGSKEKIAPGCFAIVDLGSTTVVMQLIDRKNGKIIATERFMNPQRIYGADVITRMQASLEGKKQELQQLIREALIHSLKSMEEQTGKQIERVYLAGNTTMVHLFMGYPIDKMARYPFTPWNKDMIKEEIEEYSFTILPAISAFVGGDIVSGAFALKMKPNNLLIDLGTNGEILLCAGEKMYATATAAGPAFENAVTAEVVGSDMIKVLAELLDKGIVDETGLLDEDRIETDLRYVNQQFVREMQKAKAAIRVGIELLLKSAGIEATGLETVYLAGGFGKGLDVKSAVRIGLFPEELCHKVVAVGNSVLAGLYKFGMEASLGNEEKCMEMVGKTATLTNEVNLAAQPEFNERYVARLNF